MSLKDSCVSVWESFPVSIASGQSLTDAINLGGLRLFGAAIPSVWTSADITFQVSLDNGATWIDLRQQDGTEIVMSGQTGSCIVLVPTLFAAFQFVRLRSGTSGTPVTQAADRTISLVVRSI